MSPLHASELVSFLVGLRTYQHPGNTKVLAFNILTDNVELTELLGLYGTGNSVCLSDGYVGSLNWCF